MRLQHTLIITNYVLVNVVSIISLLSALNYNNFNLNQYIISISYNLYTYSAIMKQILKEL